MNTKAEWLTTATIHDEHRAVVWGSIFPGAVLPIKSMLMRKASLPGRGVENVYMLDLDAISDEQTDRLVNMMSELFNLPIGEARMELHNGVPILAENVSVCTRDQGLFFSMMDDDS